jgi:primase-polymerase (primpol)-like protein
MKTTLNNTFEAENISTACVNPYDVKFDLWNTASKDFTAEGVNVVEAYEEQLLSIDDAAAILTAAGMAYIVTADNSDPEGHFNQARAEIAVTNTPASLDPCALPVRQWLEELHA